MSWKRVLGLEGSFFRRLHWWLGLFLLVRASQSCRILFEFGIWGVLFGGRRDGVGAPVL